MAQKRLPDAVYQSINLATLTQTSPVGWLPTPVDCAPSTDDPVKFSEVQAEDGPAQEAVLQHVRQLLAAASTYYTASSNESGRLHASCHPLAAMLQETDPHIFDCQQTGDENARAPPPATPSTSASVQLGAGQLRTSSSAASRVDELGQPPPEQQDELPPRPAAKRRRTNRSAKAASTVPAPVQESAEQSAASLQAAVDAFLDRKASDGPREVPKDSQPSSEEDEAMRSLSGRDLRRLRSLNAALLQAQHSAVMHALPAGQVRQTMQQLSEWIGMAGETQLAMNEEVDSHSYTLISFSLDACLAALRILTSPGLDSRLLDEDSIERVLAFLRMHVLMNVLVFYDARLRQLHRSGLNQQGGGEQAAPRSSGKLSRRNSRVQEHITPAAAALLGRMQAAVQLLAQLLGCVRLPGNFLLPVLRVACHTLTAQGVEVLQLSAVELLVAAFRDYASLRGPILEEVISNVLPNMDCQHRSYPVGDYTVQMASALVVQMLQVSTQLPAMDTKLEALQDCWKLAWSWADTFWNACFDRLAQQRGQRSDLDVRQLLDGLLADMLLLQHYPEWPAAATALVRFVVAVTGPRGLKNSDSTARSSSVDLLGLLVTQLYFEAGQAENECNWLHHVTGAQKDCAPAFMQRQLLDQLLLLQRHNTGSAQLCSSAREHMLCRMLFTGVADLSQAGAPADEHMQLLGSCREAAAQREVLDPALPCLDTVGGISLARAVVQGGQLGEARGPLLAKLLEAANPGKQAAANTRAKAMKALAGVIKVEKRLLDSGQEQGMVLAAISSALKDEAASVRQAAVDVLGTNIGVNAELASTYFDIVRSASNDSYPSVRKAAIKILSDSCIGAPGFPSACEACVAVLKRVNDAEESIQELVGKVFHGLWLADAPADVQNGLSSATAEQRAQQLADVAAMLYDSGDSKSIRLPLQPANPLVIALRKALDRELKSGGSVDSRGIAGRRLADALLEGFLQAQDDETGSCFPFLMALHALCVTEPALCTPQDDSERMCRCLAPYLKSNPGSTERRAAEQLMCILYIMDALLLQLGHASQDLEYELRSDLWQLIIKSVWTPAVKAACRCLGSLTLVCPSSSKTLCALAGHYYGKLQAYAQKGITSQAESGFCQRSLFALGHLLQYGSAAVESQAAREEGTLSSTAALDSLVALFRSNSGVAVQSSTLNAIGCLAVARPTVMLAESVRAVMRDVLSRNAASALKIRALTNLHDMMQEEEEAVKTRQKAEAVQQAEVEGVDLKQEIAEGDSLSLSGGIIQENWSQVLDLATDTPAHIASSSGSSKAVQEARTEAEQVRRHAINVIDDVNRNGLAPPWESIPHLVAAATDLNWDVAARALAVLGRINEKQPDMLQRLVINGLDVAAAFHLRLRRGTENLHWNITGPPRAVDKGLGCLYANLLQSKPAVHVDFLKALVRRFEALCSLRGPAKDHELSVLTFYANVALALPFKRGDEPCALIFSISSLIGSKAESILAALSPCSPGSNTADDDSAAPAAASPTSSTQRLHMACNASLAASLLLILKHQLLAAYSLTPERVAAYHPSDTERRKAEEQRTVARRDTKPGFHVLHMHAAGNAQLMQEQYKMFQGLLEADTADCGEGTPLGGRHSGAVPSENDSEEAEAVHRPTTGRRGSTGRGRGRGSAARPGQRSAGRRSTGGKVGRGRGRGAKRKHRIGMSTDDEEDSSVSDGYENEGRASSRKKLHL